jgi:hypothetical protein
MHLSKPALIRAGAASLAAVALALAAGGCNRAQPTRHVRTDRAQSVPSDIVFYAHVLYGGEDAYLVDGKWYRPAADGWVVFTEEPLELELLRRTLEPPTPSFFGF